MSRQLVHDTRRPGEPCSRCGVKSKRETAYLPCFEEGDTLKTWVSRHAELLIALKDHVPSLLFDMAKKALTKSLNARSREERLAALLIEIHYLRNDFERGDFVEAREEAFRDAVEMRSRDIDLDWKKFAEKCLRWIDADLHEESALCPARESGGVRCEREAGHPPPHECPKALAEFRSFHTPKKEK